MRLTIFILSLFISVAAAGQKKISFTFDDGITHDRPGYTFEEWNGMLLKSLDSANIQAIFFVKGGDKLNEKGRYLLSSWNDRGHKIANHTFTHPNFNKENVTYEDFKEELLLTDSIIREYSNYVKLFRFPYLKEGNSRAKVDSIRGFLKEKVYRNGHVTIDGSDWYIDSRIRERLKENPKADLEQFRKFYLEHIFERANFYEDLAFNLTGRHINHTLLLHHNLAAALFLDDLVKMFKENGWEILSADEAYKDEIFDRQPTHAGESLIWALAKQSGKFEEILRYPAEDSKYEKDKMDKLGL
jgi:peptidoglycan/xylan/chitin deacetylase (PgdA/CDA1 family)